MIIPDTLWMRIEMLKEIFDALADMGDVSLQMNAARGGVFIQVSNTEWPDGVEQIVADSKWADKLVVEVGRYSTIVYCAGDEIQS